MKIGIGIGLTTRQGVSGEPPLITATVAPSLGALSDGDTIASAMSADYDQASNYSSAAGTISTVVAAATVNGVAALFTDTVDAGDVVAVTVTVTDSEANERVFNAGSRTVAGIAPTNDVAPSIAGDTGLGDTLTVTAGTWSGAPAPTLAYQWLRGGVEITGETGTTYDITLADSGAEITVRETATNSEGSASAVSNAITADTFTAPVNTVAPSIGGDTAVGSTLTRTEGTWNGNPTPTLSGQWQRDGADISGATAATYVTVEADEGADITYLETATNAVGSASQASNAITVTAASAFTPASLFASGEEGAWYEPSPTTCFTDTAGTTPAAVGDSVARINDSSGNGNHATQATAAARPVLARVPETGRRNLFPASLDLSGVTTFNMTITENAGTSPDDVADATELATSSAGGTGSSYFYQDIGGFAASKDIIYSVPLKASGTSHVRLLGNNWSVTNPSVDFDLSDGTTSNAAGVSASGAVDLGGGWYRCWFKFNPGADVSGRLWVQLLSTDGTSGTVPLDGSVSVLMWHRQAENSASLTGLQKVVDQYDITEAGVTDLYYLDFDGVDDSFVILGSQAWYDQYIGSAVIAAYTDSTSSQDVVSNRGLDSGGAKGKYALSIRNNGVNWTYDNLVVGSGVAISTASPINTPYVFYGSGDGTNVSSSINNGSVTTVADTFTARGLDAYIGQQGNSTAYFSGRIYGIVLTNDVLTAQEIPDTKSYLAAKSGVTL